MQAPPLHEGRPTPLTPSEWPAAASQGGSGVLFCNPRTCKQPCGPPKDLDWHRKVGHPALGIRYNTLGWSKWWRPPIASGLHAPMHHREVLCPKPHLLGKVKKLHRQLHRRSVSLLRPWSRRLRAAAVAMQAQAHE
eukprot:3646474-Karenia_brevis.AAC.2